jgi:hypothetical protein
MWSHVRYVCVEFVVAASNSFCQKMWMTRFSCRYAMGGSPRYAFFIHNQCLLCGFNNGWACPKVQLWVRYGMETFPTSKLETTLNTIFYKDM